MSWPPDGDDPGATTEARVPVERAFVIQLRGQIEPDADPIVGRRAKRVASRPAACTSLLVLRTVAPARGRSPPSGRSRWALGRSQNLQKSLSPARPAHGGYQ